MHMERVFKFLSMLIMVLQCSIVRYHTLFQYWKDIAKG